jgi:hypothetical protein
MGNPSAPSAFSMKGITIAGQTYPEVFGATIAAPTWSDLMLAALQGVPVVGFAGPSPSVVAGKTVTVPDETGLSPAQAISDLQNVGLQAQVAPGPPQPLGTPAGTVGKTNPPAGASVGYGSTVSLIISNGQPVPKPSPSKKPSPKPSTSPCPKTKKCATPSPHPTPLPHNSPTAAPHGSPPAVKP